MDTVAKLTGIAFVGAVSAVFLREKAPQFSMMIALITGIVIFTLIAGELTSILKTMTDYMNASGLESDSVSAVLRISGIGIGAEYFCNVIADAGETAIAKKMEFAAKVVILMLLLPLIGKVVDTVWSLFG